MLRKLERTRQLAACGKRTLRSDERRTTEQAGVVVVKAISLGSVMRKYSSAATFVLVMKFTYRVPS